MVSDRRIELNYLKVSHLIQDLVVLIALDPGLVEAQIVVIVPQSHIVCSNINHL